MVNRITSIVRVKGERGDPCQTRHEKFRKDNIFNQEYNDEKDGYNINYYRFSCYGLWK